MSIPPVPNHPPRPGRRKPAEESPESITTQLFIGQDGSAAADGSTQALTPEELQRLQSMVDSDGTQATEVLSLEELRRLAAADGYETGGLPAAPRKANSDDIAAAEAASAPSSGIRREPPQRGRTRMSPGPPTRIRPHGGPSSEPREHRRPIPSRCARPARPHPPALSTPRAARPKASPEPARSSPRPARAVSRRPSVPLMRPPRPPGP